VTPANPQTGDVLTYTIIVTNLSTFDAELVTLTDTISGNVVFGGVVSAGGGFTLASSTTNQAVFTNSVLSAGASVHDRVHSNRHPGWVGDEHGHGEVGPAG